MVLCACIRDADRPALSQMATGKRLTIKVGLLYFFSFPTMLVQSERATWARTKVLQHVHMYACMYITRLAFPSFLAFSCTLSSLP